MQYLLSPCIIYAVLGFFVFLCFPEPSENKLQTSIHNSQNKDTLLLSQGLVTNYIRQDSNGNKTSRRYIYLYIYICIFTGEFNFRHVVRKKNPGSISYMPSWEMSLSSKHIYGTGNNDLCDHMYLWSIMTLYVTSGG